jgi:hypothetical protein
MVWKGSRGLAGKTFTLGLLGTVMAETLKADVNLLGGSGEQSERVLEHMRSFWEYQSAPRHLIVGDVKKFMHLVHGNTIRALMASQRSVRGPHPQCLLLDEVDELAWEIYEAAMGQTMAARGIIPRTIISSTHQYPEGTMNEILKLAQDRGWIVHEWCFRETSEPHGWLAASEIERKRIEVSEEMWRTEYELQEPSSEGRAIDTEAVEKMFDPSLGTFDPRNGDVLVFEKREDEGTYITAADWARKEDRTEIGTIRTDCFPARLVAYQWMNNLPWPVMVERYNNQASMYYDPRDRRSIQAIHDGVGVGDVVQGYITVRAHAETQVSGAHRTSMYNNLINAVERGKIVAPNIPFLKRQLKYVTNDDIYGNGHVPDGLAMLALAWKGATMKVAPMRVGIQR